MFSRLSFKHRDHRLVERHRPVFTVLLIDSFAVMANECSDAGSF
jgi:hypothetical protein